jgi:hypothetical protein
MSEPKPFYCLRCQHRFAAEVVPRQVVERTCPACGSNSVRQETPISAAARDSRQE